MMMPYDFERENFLAWYSRATPEDLKIGRKTNAQKLEELKLKYSGELSLIELRKKLMSR